jgi:hypothetical protein
MAELELEARRVRMRAEIEDAMRRLVAHDRNNPAHAAGAGDVVAVGDVVAIGDTAPIPPLPLVGGLVHPPLPPGPPPGQQGATPIRQPGRTPVATTLAAAVAAAVAARFDRVATLRPAAPQHPREADVFDQGGIIPPHMARLMQQQQARGNPTQGSCLSGFGGFQSQQFNAAAAAAAAAAGR